MHNNHNQQRTQRNRKRVYRAKIYHSNIKDKPKNTPGNKSHQIYVVRRYAYIHGEEGEYLYESVKKYKMIQEAKNLSTVIERTLDLETLDLAADMAAADPLWLSSKHSNDCQSLPDDPLTKTLILKPS